MNKKYRNKQKPSGDFTNYLIDYQKNDNDADSISSNEIGSDISDIDGEIIKIGNKDFINDDNKTSDTKCIDKVDIDGLFDTLGNFGGKNTQLANLYKSIDEKEKDIVQPLLEHQHKKYYRQAAYKTISKEVESWIPQITSIDNKEIITYGKSTPIEVKPQLLTSNITPINDFERELAQAETDVKLLHQNSKSEDHSNEGSNTKILTKAVIHSQNMKNKRMNRIKSKNWHRVKRKGKEFLQEKLISRVELEDPELAKQIKYEIQTKAAERRLLRKREAQNRWAKMAIRYGGKDARALASKQSQSLNDYERNIISLAKKGDSDTESDTESDMDDTESVVESGTESVNGDEIQSKHSKVYNMKFMKKARENLSPKSDQSDVEEDVSDVEYTNTNTHSVYNVRNKYNMVTECIDSNNSEDCQNVIGSIDPPKSSNVVSCYKSDIVEDIVNQKNELNRIINEVPKIYNKDNIQKMPQNELVCEIFTGNDDQLLTDSEDDEESKQTQDIGWGKWITKTNQHNTKNEQPIKKRRIRIKVVNDVDKLSKYTIKNLPYPHSNTKAFNNTLDRPLGQEWNTAKAHKRLIQPKVEIKVGNIIIPIQKKNIGNKKEVDSLLRAFGKASRAQRTLARL